jgi:hypothetical protein
VLQLHGLQVLDRGPGRFALRTPHHRAADGVWRPSIILPQSILDELAEQVKERQSAEAPRVRPR